MEEEKHSAPKPIPGTTSWRRVAPNKKGHHRKRSLSAFSRFENDGEELSISPPTILPDRRSNSSPEQRNKKKSASHIVVPLKRSITPFATGTERTDEQTKNSSNILTELKQICIHEKQTSEQTKRADAIIASLTKTSELRRKLTKSKSKSKYRKAVNSCGTKGELPLHRAIGSYQITGCKILFKANAEINIQDYRGNTALHKLFSGFNYLDEWKAIYDEFLNRKDKLKPDIPNFAGKKVFYSVILSGMYDQVNYLIQLGADVTVPTSLEDNSTPMALLNELDQNDETEMIKELLIEHGAKDSGEQCSPEITRPKTRNRKKSRESIATLRKQVKRNRITKDLLAAIEVLLSEHDNDHKGNESGTKSEEFTDVYHKIPSNPKVRREVSTRDFRLKQLAEFAKRSTGYVSIPVEDAPQENDGSEDRVLNAQNARERTLEKVRERRGTTQYASLPTPEGSEEEDKPHKTFDSMPDPKKESLITREASPSILGQRKKRGQTVYTALPISEDDEEDGSPVITIREVSSPKSTQSTEDKQSLLE